MEIGITINNKLLYDKEFSRKDILKSTGKVLLITGGILEFNYINEFIESGAEDKEVVVLSCNKCLKEYLKIGSNEDIDELNDCIDKYLD